LKGIHDIKIKNTFAKWEKKFHNKDSWMTFQSTEKKWNVLYCDAVMKHWQNWKV
jgi:hypothetical protein